MIGLVLKLDFKQPNNLNYQKPRLLTAVQSLQTC
ncbi:hypothetical protein BH11CYA1_BH11CYA1_27540 [soil metagenome]